MSFLNIPVAYLTDSDIDDGGNIITPQIPSDLPLLLMIQANFCGHCTTAKPALQEFAQKHGNRVVVATIQADGKEPGEMELAQRLSKIYPGFSGFPEYMLFKDKKPYKKHDGGRSVEDLEKFVFE
jgi:thiol-disulfide isomerase/thioredoxin